MFKLLKSPCSGLSWRHLLPYALANLAADLDPNTPLPSFVVDNLLDALAAVWCHLSAANRHLLPANVALSEMASFLHLLVSLAPSIGRQDVCDYK